ncbi:hypothetical protein VKT23_007863 [Stygiomarasmius scandens]|uniref:Uncharacterized protein n=1 Tax=Marasmiellus scandens TaxID=2682957 RepID=A0ABR1JLX1_9AGAR
MLLESNVNSTGQDQSGIEVAPGASPHKRFKIDKSLTNDSTVDINAIGGYYGTALQVASYRGHKAIVEFLLDKGADVNVKGGDLTNALNAAVAGDHDSIAKFLLDKGAIFDAQAPLLENAFYTAVDRRYEPCLNLLLGLGVDISTPEKCETALIVAARAKEKDVVQFLLDRVADTSVVKGKYGTALKIASEKGFKDVVELLLSRGADVNACNGNALQAASYEAHENVVRLLLDHGADVNAVGDHDTALHAALVPGQQAGKKDDSIAKLLIEKGADVNFCGRKYGYPLILASYFKRESIVKILLEKGARITVRSGNGRTPSTALQAAYHTGYGSKEASRNIIKLLKEHGAKFSDMF